MQVWQIIWKWRIQIAKYSSIKSILNKNLDHHFMLENLSQIWGILPYTIPLFLGIPFHEYTVNAVNALLTLHACILHSSCHWEYGNLSGVLGFIMISPIGHNMHHQYGVHNACNFAPIFKHWDRILGTLNDSEPFWWKKDRAFKKAMFQQKLLIAK